MDLGDVIQDSNTNKDVKDTRSVVQEEHQLGKAPRMINYSRG
ncbi:hypothetical protein SAMN02745723_11618 [Pragia fontium DSM 5563 = ATCC 49100]|uniref:Uncharacterized protein n=1 Tax=Pragia fontium DSM 5563 = ATCC 49100 TaxID=1122977 RepID=A0AAJ5BIK5_9GAMM|nr:hypothetical protein SAMN02745723_11618 [Pragia fontium DSM 5563 = ATCC 49100]